ncbi:MAG TPA: hypothetical protein DCM73_00475 [Clostridiales bacterium]|nr:hypothetical protein [Clostridiales bacterium]
MKNINPYLVRNMIVKKVDTPEYGGILDVIGSDKFGYLRIGVFHDDINEPVENAEVLIYLVTISGIYQEKGEGILITTVTTGADGYAPVLRLPALNKLQQSDIDSDVYRMYMAAVYAEGFFSAYAFDIQIYPDVTTSYRINLRLISEGETPFTNYEFIIEPKI